MADKRGSIRSMTDDGLLERLQSILVNTAEGRRSVSDDRQYNQLRVELQRRKIKTPRLVSVHPTVDSFAASLQGFSSKADRVSKVLNDFADIGRHQPDFFDSSGWTGVESPAARVRFVRSLLPFAETAVENLIGALSEAGSNGGPILDEREEAIAHLRHLHRTLGELLHIIDSGHFEDDLGHGLAAEAVRYAKRATDALRDDPMPYATSALILGVLSACGLAEIGAYMSSVALTVQKKVRSR